jgi:hypothetical protein
LASGGGGSGPLIVKVGVALEASVVPLPPMSSLVWENVERAVEPRRRGGAEALKDHRRGTSYKAAAPGATGRPKVLRNPREDVA